VVFGFFALTLTLSPWADLDPHPGTGHGELKLNEKAAQQSACFVKVTGLNSSPQPPSLEKRRGSKRLLPLSFKRGGRGVSSRGAGHALILLHFLTSPCPVKNVGHDQPRGRGDSYVSAKELRPLPLGEGWGEGQMPGIS